LSLAFITTPLVLADLLSKLSGERSRWAQQLAALDGQLAELPRAALASAAFITYLPAHPEDVREQIMQGWTRWEQDFLYHSLTLSMHCSCCSSAGCDC
jgi:hypothetical protein